MANATPSRLGAINGGTDKLALFLKVFSGEVLTSFNTGTVFLDKHSVRTIASGKSAQFPAIGKTTAYYHVPGEEINGQAISHAEQIITIDDLLISPVFIANIDEAMNHYDVRSEYTRQCTDALVQTFDTQVARMGLLAARAAGTITGIAGGSELTNANYRVDAATLASGLFDAAQVFDEKNVPEMDRYVFVKPAQYYLLTQKTDLINKDWDGRGSYAAGKIQTVAGITIVKTNNLPTTNVTTGPTKYRGDYSNVAALVMNKWAVGTVKLRDLTSEAEYQIQRQGYLAVSKYLMGHGILRPHCAVELNVST